MPVSTRLQILVRNLLALDIRPIVSNARNYLYMPLKGVITFFGCLFLGSSNEYIERR